MNIYFNHIYSYTLLHLCSYDLTQISNEPLRDPKHVTEKTLITEPLTLNPYELVALCHLTLPNTVVQAVWGVYIL